MTDQQILDLMFRGHLHVCHQTLDIHKYHNGFNRFVRKIPNQHPLSGRYRFTFNGRRTIYRNKLVWIYFNRRLVPTGYVIDHMDQDRLNDHPGNLTLQPERESHRQGNTLQPTAQKAMDYFDFIAFMGREPSWSQ